MKSEFKKVFIGNKPSKYEFVKLERTYCNQAQFESIQNYANKMDYNLKFKISNAQINIFNGVLRQKKYYDLILEKNLRNGRKRHGFISIERNSIMLTYKHYYEDISFYVSSVNISNKKLFEPDNTKLLFEPSMFVEYNVIKAEGNFKHQEIIN